MAVYKFKITFEDYDEVTREIEIKSNQTFEDFHNAIHKAIGFDGNFPSSFYMSNDFWHKGKEITLKENSIKNKEKTVLMNTSLLKNFIEDPHQKIYYIFNHDNPWTFLIELLKITIQEDPKITYPICTKSQGEAPKQFGNATVNRAANDDFDFLNETTLDGDDEEVDGMGFDDDLEESNNMDESSEFDNENTRDEY